MKKTIILFSLPILTLALILLKPKNVYADTLKDLSYASSSNLIDPSIVEQNDYKFYTTKKICIASREEDYLTIQVDERYCDGNIFISVEFFDVDLNSISSIMLDASSTKLNDVQTEYATFEIPHQAFSFKINESGYMQDGFFDNECETLMAFIGVELNEQESFVPHTRYVDITDTFRPEIIVEYSNPVDESVLKSFVGAYDAYDGKITDGLSIVATSYLNSSGIIGKYTIVVTAIDSQGNKKVGTYFVNVVDTDKPVISGPDSIEWPICTDLIEGEIYDIYRAIDAYMNTDLSDAIEIGEYTINSPVVKDETVTLSVSDSSGNVGTKDITIHFYDNIAPVIEGPTTLDISTLVQLTAEEIKEQYFSVTDNVDEDIELIITNNTYTGNEGVVGEYSITFTAQDERGNITNKTLSLTVSDKIPPVIYLNSYMVETNGDVILARNDLDDILMLSGELDRNKTYDVKVLVDTYSGHEREKGTYVYQAEYMSENGQKFTKTMTIVVKNDSYSIGEKTIKTNTLSTQQISLLVASSIASISLLSFLIIFNKKKVK